MPFTYPHPRPALTVDCVVFALGDGGLEVLLVRRGRDPFKGRWALPGGFVNLDESVDEAARRELREETGLDRVYLEQLQTFGDLDRDPRERVVSVAHLALVRRGDHAVKAASDASDAAWFAAGRVPKLAFDHAHILAAARDRLAGKVRYRPIGFELLPPRFTLTRLQALYEAVLDRPLDKRNFRKKILGMGILVELDETEAGVSHRAARLFRFDKQRYQSLVKAGFHFAL